MERVETSVQERCDAIIHVLLVEEGKPTEVDVTSCRVNNRRLDRVQKHKSSDAYEIAQPINYLR